jgi:hypothetical protein
MSSKRNSQNSPTKKSTAETAKEVSIQILYEEIEKLVKGMNDLKKRQIKMERMIKKLQEQKQLPVAETGGVPWTEPYTVPPWTTTCASTTGKGTSIDYSNYLGTTNINDYWSAKDKNLV